eukprot:TRINITY_DN31440_c0_g2_i1.p1 TRINITY_DN31440_c0_g2~~TRINITY_DN31440_c0_g2_i1.p1  ORF type:complete len:487 (-),score=87.50 TRINITY_DN31440_c0_g2_i1:221-1627(-)
MSTTIAGKAPKAAIAGIAACALSAVLVFRRWRRRRLPPGSMGWPLFGETLQYIKDPCAWALAKLEQHGGSTCKSNLLFNKCVILAPTEANAKLICSKSLLGWPSHWKNVVGRTSLPFVNDPVHKRIRNLSSRAFTDVQLDSYLPTLQALTAKHLQLWDARGSENRDLYFDIKLYAFEMAQTVIMGLEFPAEKIKRQMHLFEKTCSGLMSVFPVDIPGTFWHEVLSCRKQLVAEYQEIMDQRRKELEAGAKATSMLDQMLIAEGVTDVELQDFCIAMLFAGHDTTLSSMQTAIYYLSQNSAIAADLVWEVQKAWDGSSPITRETMKNLPKTKAFLHEAWRMTPPVAAWSRQLAEDTVVDGYLVPKGWTLNFYPAAVSNKVQSPKTFSLDRCLDKSGSFIDQVFQPWNFGIFGGGARMCIGYKFSRDEMLIFMVQLLHKYNVIVESAAQSTFPFNFWRVTGRVTARLVPP